MTRKDVKITKSLDEKTGESIEHCTIPEKLLPEIEKRINKGMQFDREFAVLSQQYLNALARALEIRNEIGKIQGDLSRTLRLVCKKMGLEKDSRWVFNIQLKVMERRTPPSVGPPEYKEGGPDGQGKVGDSPS